MISYFINNTVEPINSTRWSIFLYKYVRVNNRFKRDSQTVIQQQSRINNQLKIIEIASFIRDNLHIHRILSFISTIPLYIFNLKLYVNQFLKVASH